MTCTNTRYYYCDHINEDKMRYADSMYVWEENSYKVLGWNLKERDHFEAWRRWDDNNKIGFKQTGLEGMKWIHLAQYRNKWRALADMVTKLHFLQITECFLIVFEAMSFSRTALFLGVRKQNLSKQISYLEYTQIITTSPSYWQFALLRFNIHFLLS